MIRGTADIEQLALHAPYLLAWPAETVWLKDVACMQCTVEMRNSAREAVLPSSLHPTIPAALSVGVWQVRESPWGAFTFAFTRISCRSGVRARGLTSAAYIDNAAAGDALRTQYGFPVHPGQLTLRWNYAGVEAQVRHGERTILDIGGLDAEPMGADDVQYTGTLNLAHTPNGLRLVQVEAEHQATRVERLKPKLRVFASEDWGNSLLVPSRVVSASMAQVDIELPAIRFVCKPDELAFTGTEAIKR